MKLARKTDWNGGDFLFCSKQKRGNQYKRKTHLFITCAKLLFHVQKNLIFLCFSIILLHTNKRPVTKLFQTLATSNAIPGFRLFDVESQKLKVLVSHHFRWAGISENTRRAIGISFEYHHENIACSDIHALALIFESFLDG